MTVIGVPTRRILWTLAFLMLFLMGSSTSVALHDSRRLSDLAVMLPAAGYSGVVCLTLALARRGLPANRMPLAVAAPAAFLFLWRLLSYLMHPSFRGALEVAVMGLGAALFVTCAGRPPSPGGWLPYLTRMALAAAPAAALAITEVFLPRWDGPNPIPAQSTLGNPNLLAGVLAPLSVILVWGALRGGDRVTRRSCAALAVVLLAGLAASGSRGGFLGLAAGLMALFLLDRRAQLPAAARYGLLLGLVAVLARVGTVHRTNLSEGGRVMVWQAAAQTLLRQPLTGVGVGRFPVAYARQWGLEHRLGAPDDRYQRIHLHAHSLPLQYGAETGVPGLLGLLALFWGIGRGALRALRGADGNQRDLAVVAGAALCAMLVQGLFDYLLWSLACSAVLWSLAGFVVAAGSPPERFTTKDPEEPGRSTDAPLPAAGDAQPARASAASVSRAADGRWAQRQRQPPRA